MKAICKFCKKEFSFNKSSGGKYCSYKCYWKSLCGRKLPQETIKKLEGRIAWNKGKKCPEMSGKNHWTFGKKRLEISGKNHYTYLVGRPNLRAEKNPCWKGEKAGLIAKHTWIAKMFGKPMKCEICGATDKKDYEWANKNHTYSRKREDWLRLCVSCHKNFDKAWLKHKGAWGHNKLGIRGIFFDKERNKYQTRIKVNGKNYFLGRFNTIQEAQQKYNTTLKKFNLS